MSTEQAGGAAHSRPTRFLSELAISGSTRIQEPQNRTRTAEEILKESARIGYSLLRAVRTARPAFIDLSLTEPGIVELEDNFYTGWFYTVEAGGKYSAYRNIDNVSASPFVNKKRRPPYFLLDKSEAIEWDQSIKKGPLSIDLVDGLCLSPGIEAHPYYQSLAGLDLASLTDIASSLEESFWNEFLAFGPSDKSEAKRELLRINLLDLVMLETIHRRSYRAALREAR